MSDDLVDAGSNGTTGEPPGGEGLSEEVFVVSNILEHAIFNKTINFKVSWEGYGPDEDSWEPIDNLEVCAAEAIHDYITALPEKERKAIEKQKEKMVQKSNKKRGPKKDKKSEYTPRGTSTRKPRERSTSVADDSHGSLFTGGYSSGDNASLDIRLDLKKSKGSSSTKKGRKRSKADHSDSEDDDEYAPKKKNGHDNGPRSVPTKAALKSYEPQHSAHKAAQQRRSGWLMDGASDSSDEDEAKKSAASFDAEIKAKIEPAEKIKKKKEKVSEEKPADSPAPLKIRLKKPTAGEDASIVSTVYHSKQEKTEDHTKVLRRADAVFEQLGSHATSSDNSNDWKIDGIVQHTSNNEHSLIVLVKNEVTGECRTATPREAYEMNGWNFVQYLLQRCIF